MKFEIHADTAALLAATQATLKSLPKKATRKLKKGPYAISVSLVTPKAIQALNKKYRKRNKATDVLSFSRLEGPQMPNPDIGDVLICLKVAKAQAKEYGVTLKEELQRLTVHGVLHLFGYDHEVSKNEERRMFRLQEKILRKLNR